MNAPRRRLLAALLAAAWAPTLLAQSKGRSARAGFLSPGSAKPTQHLVNAWQQGLADVGYHEGRNLVVDYRWADGNAERLPALARELVALRPALIVAHGNAAAAALKAATSDIPVVMVAVDDPVRSGFAKGLRRPAGNMTGITSSMETGGRQLALLKQVNPKLATVAVVSNPGNTFHDLAFQSLSSEAKNAKVRLVRASVRSAGDIDKAFAALRKEKAQGVIVLEDPLYLALGERLAKALAAARLPSVSVQRELAEAGGLASYGSSGPAVFRRAAAHTARVLNGFKVAEVSIEAPAQIELVVNLKAAKAMKVSVPKDLLAKADHVLQ